MQYAKRITSRLVEQRKTSRSQSISVSNISNHIPTHNIILSSILRYSKLKDMMGIILDDEFIRTLSHLTYFFYLGGVLPISTVHDVCLILVLHSLMPQFS